MSESIKYLQWPNIWLQGKKPEVLFWVGCAGSFDDQSQKNYQGIC